MRIVYSIFSDCIYNNLEDVYANQYRYSVRYSYDIEDIDRLSYPILQLKIRV